MNGLHYWNRANFVGLLEVADAADTRGLGSLAAYCRLREKGLRRKALDSLQEFVRETQALSGPQQRDALAWVATTIVENPAVHHLRVDPLLRLVERVLADWAFEPEGHQARRLLALLHQDIGALRSALESDPEDERCRAALIGVLLRAVDYNCHHLHEGLFIGSEIEAQADLEEARQHISRLPEGACADEALRAHDELAVLLNDWLAFQRDGSGEFVAWCEGRGHYHRWWATVYYGE